MSTAHIKDSYIAANGSPLPLNTRIKHYYQWWFGMLADIVPTVFTKILPNAIRWLYRTALGRITKHSITTTIGKETKTARLYFHGAPKNGWSAKTPVVLLIPGDNSPACILLHLADIAQKSGDAAAFSLCIPKSADSSHPTIDQTLVTLAIDQIEKIMTEHHVEGKPVVMSHVEMVGHSRGGIQSAYQLFVVKDARVRRIFVVGTRVRFVDSLLKPCDTALIPAMHTLEGALSPVRDERFMQVIGAHDWAVPVESISSKHPHRILKNASHSGAVYHPDTLAELSHFLNRNQK